MAVALRAALGFTVWLASAFVAFAQSPAADTIFFNGKIVTLEFARPIVEALAVRDGKIVAVGSPSEIDGLAGPSTRRIDLGGRTVIPGLIDSHIHAIRAGLTYATEVNWAGAGTIAEALARIRAKAEATSSGSWIVVAGGWTEQQFAEKRRPTQAELTSAAPGRAVYVQLFYSAVLLTPAGFERFGISGDSDIAPPGKLERDGGGRPTGWISGDAWAISSLFARLPRPSLEQKIAGTRAFFRELNSLGLTGVIDPGGYDLTLGDYEAIFGLWREKALTLRVAYSLCARPGSELEDLRRIAQATPMGSGDDWLRFNGVGERVTFGMYNNEAPSDAEKDALRRVLLWTAAQGQAATFHWNNDRSVHHLLGVLERVNADNSIARLRWSIAHLHDASDDSLRRMKALGVGWLTQNAFYFRGDAFLRARGVEAARRSPPVVTALRMGLAVGAGTDAHRVMTPNPFQSLQWYLDGKTIGGASTRALEEIPTREEALRLYTLGAAWFSHDEQRRGSLAVGKLADLVVLTADYLTVPVEEIGAIRSVLTMVGGHIVHASGSYAAFQR